MMYGTPTCLESRMCSLVCGLGPCARESFLEPDELLEQLREAYREGYAGAALFSFDARFVEDLVPALRIAR